MSSLTTQEAVELTVACVPCRKCGANAGEKCTSKRGKVLGSQVCVQRRMDMIHWRRDKRNRALYVDIREGIASKRSKPLPPSKSQWDKD